MRRSLFLPAILCLLAPSARANVCSASYQAEGAKPTAWKGLGDVTGAKMAANCFAMAKNDAGNKKPADLGVTKEAVCAAGTIAVTVFTRLDAKEKRDPAEAVVVKTSLGVDCPKPKAKDAKEKEPAAKKPAEGAKAP